MSNLITGAFIKEFILSNHFPFAATQSKLRVPIVVRMCQKMSYNIRFDDIKICDNLVIDGHHRYLSALIMKFDIDKSLTNKTSVSKAIDWPLLELDEEDWDTPAKIAHLNELDAKYNNLEIDFIRQIIKDDK